MHSSSSLLAMAFPETVQNNCGLEVQQAATENFWQLSSLKEALIAAETGGVHAMHDPTEGGVATAIHELAQAAGLGVVVWQERLLISEETKRLCHEFQLNPLGVISSGALLIAAEPTKSSEIMSAVAKYNIPCGIIGQLLPPENGRWIEENGQRRPLPIFESDEITKIFVN